MSGSMLLEQAHEARAHDRALVHDEHAPSPVHRTDLRGRRVRHLGANASAPVRGRFHLQRAAEVLGPRGEPLQAEGGARHGRVGGERGDVEAATVVLDDGGRRLAAEHEADPHLVGVGMLDDVRERLLDDAEQLVRGLGRERPAVRR